MSATLVEFLHARITEEESWFLFPGCHEIVSPRGPGWMTPEPCHWCEWWGFDGTESTIKAAWYEHVETRHDRTRRLIELEVKRRILDIHWVNDEDDSGQHDCPGTWVNGCDDQGEPCPTLRLFGLPYVNHPEYREEWRP